MKITGTLTMVEVKKSKKKDKDGKEIVEVPEGPGFEMKVSDVRFWNDNPYFLRAGVSAHDFLLDFEKPAATKSEKDEKLNDERRARLLEEGTVAEVPFECEYTASGTLDLKLFPEPKEPTDEELDAAAENLVRTERTPDGQPADSLPVDKDTEEFKDALKRVKEGRTEPSENLAKKKAKEAEKKNKK